MVIVPGGCGFCASFKRAAVFANSAMSVGGGFPLRLQILTGLLSEKTGPARIAPPLYADGFSRDLDTWMFRTPCLWILCLSRGFLGQWLLRSPICFLDFWDLEKTYFMQL